MINENGVKIHKYVWNEREGLAKLGRLTRANLSFGMSFKSKQGSREAQENRELIEDQNVLPGGVNDTLYDRHAPVAPGM